MYTCTISNMLIQYMYMYTFIDGTHTVYHLWRFPTGKWVVIGQLECIRTLEAREQVMWKDACVLIMSTMFGISQLRRSCTCMSTRTCACMKNADLPPSSSSVYMHTYPYEQIVPLVPHCCFTAPEQILCTQVTTMRHLPLVHLCTHKCTEYIYM